jgi:RNA polymerase sigma factor (sigma-70 family)
MREPERSISAIYKRYHQSLYRFCFSIVGNAEDAQDALQNTMVKALRALPGEERQIQLKPWLYRVAHNESIEILRKRRDEARIEPELAASTAGPEEAAATRERLGRLLADLAELPDRQRTALVMRELSGLGFAEIGEALGTSAAAVRQTLYEARLSLHELEAGREMSCASVMRQISDEDRRTLRRRDIKAHLRACPQCRAFRDSIEGRSRDLAAIAPLPLAASAGILHALLGSAGGHASASAGTGAASAVGAGAGKAVATSAVLKSAATVAVVAAIGVSAADRGGLIDAGLPGGNGGTAASESTSTGGGDGAATAAPGRSASSAAAAGKSDAGATKQGTSTSGAGKSRSGGHGATANEHAANGRATSEGQSPGATGALPPASQHGQETAATHKAEPGAPSAGTHHQASPGGSHSGNQGSVHSHAPAAHSHSGSHHSHGGSRHSHKAAGVGTSHPHPPPNGGSQPQSPAPAEPESSQQGPPAASGQTAMPEAG